MNRLFLLLTLCVCLSTCGSSAAPQASKATPWPCSTPLERSEPEDAEPDTDEANTQDDDLRGDEDDSDPENFHGYPCLDDCSGHEAGYKWAEAHGIDDPDDCGGKSQSFIEGCRAWAEENP